MATISQTYEPVENESAGVLAWLVRLTILFFIGAVLVSVALLSLLAAFRVHYAERITPGVSVLGVALDGMTREEAIATLDAGFTYDAATIFTFRDGERTWQLSAGTLGLTFDSAATVDQALAVSRPHDIIGGLRGQADTWFNGRAIAPIIHYDQNRAIAQLERIAAEIERPAQDSALTVGDDFALSVSSGQTGRTMDIEATLETLNTRMLALSGGGEIPLVIHESVPQVWHAEDAIHSVQVATSAPVHLLATNAEGETLGPWTISPEQIAALLQVRAINGADEAIRYDATIDLSGYAAALNQLAAGLRTEPADGRFRFDNNTRQLVAIQPPQLGRALDVAATIERLEAAVFSEDARTVQMVFNYVQPQYHAGITGEELGITELIGSATTYYHGSDNNRRHNIAEGAARLNGVIIAPGDEFSFNDHIGDITYESGFRDGHVIVGGSTVTGVGGGICQVSTTIFRAALNGGYWITERNTHAYRVHYYELNNQWPGLDAAIWSPDRDFKFLNDTPHHVLIEAVISPNESTLTFNLYSQSIGRTVELVEPEIRAQVPAPPERFISNPDLSVGEIRQVEMAAEGMDVVVIRRVTDADGNTRTDRVFTHYLPWSAVFEVAPGDPRLQSRAGG